MPTATIPRTITPQEAAEALRQQLGSGYKVTPHSGGSRDKLTVSHGGPAFATAWPGTGMPPPSMSTAAA